MIFWVDFVFLKDSDTSIFHIQKNLHWKKYGQISMALDKNWGTQPLSQNFRLLDFTGTISGAIRPLQTNLSFRWNSCFAELPSLHGQLVTCIDGMFGSLAVVDFSTSTSRQERSLRLNGGGQKILLGSSNVSLKTLVYDMKKHTAKYQKDEHLTILQ